MTVRIALRIAQFLLPVFCLPLAAMHSLAQTAAPYAGQSSGTYPGQAGATYPPYTQPAPRDASAAPNPVATNLPSGPATTKPLRPAERPAGVPISPDTPRTSAVPPGQFVAEDYKIGPQDLLEVQVYGLEGLKRDVRVNSRGVITLPLIGTVPVGGLTSQEAEELIRASYEKDYLRNPQVSLFIKEYTSQRITVEGAVNRPGVYPIKGQTSLLQAIAIAGGQGALSDMTQVLLFRVADGEKKTMKYDVMKIRSGEMDDPMLFNEDVIVVNRSGARTALRDSLFRDIIDTINPFSYMRPVP